MIFAKQLTRQRCRFCHKDYSWEALSVHERVCVASEGYTDRDELITHETYKKYDIQKDKYLKRMKKILEHVKKMRIDRQQRYEKELFNGKFKFEKENNTDKYNHSKEFLEEETQNFIKKWENEVVKLLDMFKNMHSISYCLPLSHVSNLSSSSSY